MGIKRDDEISGFFKLLYEADDVEEVEETETEETEEDSDSNKKDKSKENVDGDVEKGEEELKSIADKNKDYDSYVEALRSKLDSKDEDIIAALTDMYKRSDGTIKGKEQEVPVLSLHPSQNEIDLDATFSKMADNGVSGKFGDVVNIGPLLVVYKADDAYYIMDGHHRWSQALAVNPKAKVKCLVFEDAGGPMDMLKTFKAYLDLKAGGKSKDSTVGQHNLFDMDLNSIYKLAMQKLPSVEKAWKPAIEEGHVKLKGKDGNVKEAKGAKDVIEYYAKNLNRYKGNVAPMPGAPKRTLMPQLDADTVNNLKNNGVSVTKVENYRRKNKSKFKLIKEGRSSVRRFKLVEENSYTGPRRGHRRMSEGAIAQAPRGKCEILWKGNGETLYRIDDATAAVDLGKNTGWAVAGRYGHYGEPDFVPSVRVAESHFNDYKNLGGSGYGELYYLVDDGTGYGLEAWLFKTDRNGSYSGYSQFDDEGYVVSRQETAPRGGIERTMYDDFMDRHGAYNESYRRPRRGSRRYNEIFGLGKHLPDLVLLVNEDKRNIWKAIACVEDKEHSALLLNYKDQYFKKQKREDPTHYRHTYGHRIVSGKEASRLDKNFKDGYADGSVRVLD